MPGLKDGTNDDARVVDGANGLSIMDDVPNVDVFKEDDGSNKMKLQMMLATKMKLQMLMALMLMRMKMTIL
jgi:hypothetical protein